MAGLLDDLNEGVAQGMNSPLFALGMGLIGGAQPFANPAQQIQGARTAQLGQQGQQLDLQMQKYGLQQMQAMMPYAQKLLEGAAMAAGPMPAGGGLMGGAGGQSSVPNIPQMPSLLGQPMTGAPGPQQAPSAGPAPGQQPQGALPDPAALAQRGAALSQLSGLPVVGPMLGAMGASQTAYSKDIPALRDYQQKTLQLQTQPLLDKIDGAFNSKDPQTALQDPQLAPYWQSYQQAHPQAQLSPETARAALAVAGNNVRGVRGDPAKDYPVPVQAQAGPYGQSFDVDPVTGKRTQVAPAHTPTMTYEQEPDPNDPTKTIIVPRQTGGWPGSGGGVAAPAPGTTPKPGPNAFYKAPSTEETKSAELAGYMRSGLSGVEQLENQGYQLSPKARALIINAATSDNDKFMDQLVSQWSAKHLLSAKDQTYMAALMPMLQAAGHSMAGARLTLGQVRQNFESLVPVDINNQAAMTQIEQNRQNYYKGLLGEAGTAVQLPQYRTTLASDLQRFSTPKTAPDAALSYLKAHPELKTQFQSKYGYAP